MPDDLNPQASSQPGNAPGPNAGGKTSEGGSAPVMTPSQDRHFYNETQRLATERKAVESERAQIQKEKAELERSRAEVQQRQGQGGGYPGGFQGAGYPNPYGAPAMGGMPGMGFPPGMGGGGMPTAPNYTDLVKEFGPDGAKAMWQTIQTFAEPVKAQMFLAEHRLANAERIALETDIRSRGAMQYGEAWKEHGEAVMSKVRQFGMPLADAWKIIQADELQKANELATQKGRDEAYQMQLQKEAAQVAQQGAGPSPQAQPKVGSYADAFQAALKEHGTA